LGDSSTKKKQCLGFGWNFGKNYQLLGKSSGFQVAATHRPCTKGLWMWSTPIKRTAADGSEYSLVLLDSEGIDSYDQTVSQLFFSLCLFLFLLPFHLPFLCQFSKFVCFCVVGVLLEVLKGRENTNFEAEKTGNQTYLNLIFTTHLIIIISPLMSLVKILSLSVQEKCKRRIGLYALCKLFEKNEKTRFVLGFL
jgi:hypothetical protein